MAWVSIGSMVVQSAIDTASAAVDQVASRDRAREAAKYQKDMADVLRRANQHECRNCGAPIVRTNYGRQALPCSYCKSEN